GRKGVRLSALRTAGKIRIVNQTFEASSTGEFIARDTAVKVVRYEAAQLYVEPISNHPY
ncbi:MAG: NfeD family protein, partial [Muribaculaceae bacterium]|nr:NfeD family protein [Muribaculaceae bacterium]